jgi:Cys-tRNA(Pro)/Cys-tRNA(Cys) deacylase
VALVNNVTRLLDSAQISYIVYQLPAEKLSALETARLLEVDPAIVFKTIVITRPEPHKPVLVLVPGTQEVDLRLLARALGDKKVYLPTEREAEALTGLQAGGISPLVLINRGFRVVIDSSARNYQQIHISAGQRGLNLKLGVGDLVTLTTAHFAKVARSGTSTRMP